jgi:hypothetical protein
MKPIGGVVHPIYLHLLIDPLGYPTAIRWSALVIGVSAIAACTLMRTRLPRKEWDGKAVFLKSVCLNMLKINVLIYLTVGLAF